MFKNNNDMSFPNRPLLQVLREEWKIWLTFSVLVFIFTAFLLNAYSFNFLNLLRYPIAYGGDGLSHSWMIQRVVEGWVFDNFRSGYPFGSNFLDYTVPDAGSLLVLKILGKIFGSYYVVYTVYYLISFPLAFIAAFAVMRTLDIRKIFAVCFALLYAFTYFHWDRIGHLFYTFYWVVPIYIYYAIICFRCFKDRSFKDIPKKEYILHFLALLTLSSFGVYYAAFAMLSISFSGLAGALFRKSFKNLFVGAAMSLVILFGVIIWVTPNIYNKISIGGNPNVGTRFIHESEYYGLKLSHLVVPPESHFFPEFKRVSNRYYSNTHLRSEGASPYLGLVGICGFFILLITIFTSNVRRILDLRLQILGGINLFLFLFATIGGFSALFALFVSSSLRGWNRISIFIAFLALSAFAIVFQLVTDRFFLNKKTSDKSKRNILFLICVAIFVFGFVDQHQVSGNVNSGKAIFNSDKKMISLIESKLPSGSAIYQLPYMQFPEVPPLNNLGDYQEARGFFNSKNLLWNYGGMKYRNGDLFYRELSKKDIKEQLEIISKMGFSGIMIFRKGYADNGAEIEAQIEKFLGHGPEIVSDIGDISFFPIVPERPPFKNAVTPADIGDITGIYIGKDGMLRYKDDKEFFVDFTRKNLPLSIENVSGLSGEEVDGRWSDANLSPTLQITFNKNIPKKTNLKIEAQSFGPNGNEDTIIKIGKVEKKIKIANEVKICNIIIDTDGTSNTIEIIPPDPRSPLSLGVNNDSRKLGIKFKSISLEEL